MDAVSDGIKNLKSEAERAAITEALGLGGLSNALRDGTVDVAALRDEARALGIVIDAEMIQRASDAQGQLDTLAQIIDINLKSAFIDLAPVIVRAIELVAQLAADLADALDQWRELDKKTGRGLDNERKKLVQERDAIAAQFGTTPLNGQRVVARPVAGQTYTTQGIAGQLANLTKTPELPSASNSAWGLFERRGQRVTVDAGEQFDNAGKRIAEIDAEKASRAETASPTRTDRSRGTSLSPATSRTRTPRDTSARDAQREAEREARRAERVEQEIFRARQRALGIYDRETATVQERYDIERAQTEMERKAEQEQLDSRLARKDITEAEYTQLKLLNDQAAALEDRVASDVLARDLADERLAKERMLTDLTVELLSLQSGAARTAKERRDIELRLLALAQQNARDELETRLSRTPGLSDTDKKAQRDLLTQIQEAQTAAANRANMGPLEAWRDQSLKSAGEIAEAYENVAARGLDALNDGIVDAIMNTRDLGEVFSNVAKQIIADLVSIGVRQSITEPLAARLFGTGAQKATSTAGGNILQGIGGAQGGGGWLSSLFKLGKGLFGFSSGGYTGDGGKLEPKGVVHGGEYVFSKEAVQRIGAGNLEALHKNLKGFSMGGLVGPALPALALQGAGPVSRGGDAPYFDLRGAVMTQDLLKQMNAIGAQAESRANTWATKNVPDLAQSKAAKRQQHQIGRRKR